MFRDKVKKMAIVVGILVSGIFMIPNNTNARCELDCGDVVYICPDGHDCSVIGGTLTCEGAPAGPVNCGPGETPE